MSKSITKSYPPGDTDGLGELAGKVLEQALAAGASDAEVGLGSSSGLHIEVREGEVETIEHNRGQGLSLTVYVGHRKGSASTNDFRDESLADAIEAAVRIANAGNEDPHAGLADPKWLASTLPDLDLDHPVQIEPAQAIESAVACESAALAVDSRISNSEGASFSRDRSSSVYANSNGFNGGVSSTRYSLGASVLTGNGDNMQRAHWYDSARMLDTLTSADEIGRTAGERAVARIGARKIASTNAPVLFEAPIAASLIGHMSSAISGSALYRRASFLLDAVDTVIFPEQLQIAEHPHLRAGAASASFDSDGVATRERDIVKDGRLLSYALSVYAARRLGLEPTGNGGGLRNVSVEHTGAAPSLDELCQQMGEGLLVTGLMGFGVNNVTGDYSRGATGFWIENGEIAYPVEEITIAGKLQDMFKGIAAVGSDIDRRGNVHCGSILINQMAIAGD